MNPNTLTIPIFPLPDAVFFPNTLLPLHIFEPRYKEMVSDALAADKQIGIVQLRLGWDKDYFGSPPVYKVLGVGEIVESHEWPDGRFDILLAGRHRAQILSEGQRRDYRIADTQILREQLNEDDAREVTDVHLILISILKKLRDAMPDTAALLQGQNPEDLQPGALVDVIANIVVENPYDRQSLLAETNLARRQQLLRVQLRSIFKVTETEEGSTEGQAGLKE